MFIITTILTEFRNLSLFKTVAIFIRIKVPLPPHFFLVFHLVCFYFNSSTLINNQKNYPQTFSTTKNPNFSNKNNKNNDSDEEWC